MRGGSDFKLRRCAGMCRRSSVSAFLSPLQMNAVDFPALRWTTATICRDLSSISGRCHALGANGSTISFIIRVDASIPMCHIPMMDRKTALASGLRFYDNGRKCPLNHESTVRYAITGKCLECCKDEGSRYQPSRAAYYRAHAAANVAKSKTWKLANPERRKQLAAEYRERHRLELRARSVAYRETHTTPLLDKRVRENNRRSRKAKAGGAFTPQDVERLFSLQRGRCAYCRKPLRRGYQVDHIMPIRLNGHSNPSNLQLLCAPCNWSKQGKHPIDFVRGRGLLV